MYKEYLIDASSLLVSLTAGLMLSAAILKLLHWGNFVAWLASLRNRWLPPALAAGSVVTAEALAAVCLLSASSVSLGLVIALSVLALTLAGRFLTLRVAPTGCECLGNASPSTVRKVAFAMGILGILSASVLLVDEFFLPETLESGRLESMQGCICMLLGAYLFRDSSSRHKKSSFAWLKLSPIAQSIIDKRHLAEGVRPTLIVFVSPGCQGCVKLLELVVSIEALLPGEYRKLVHVAGSSHNGSVMGVGLEIISEDIALMTALGVRATPSAVVLRDGQYVVSSGLAACVAALGVVIAAG